jgi:thiamine-phosphate pyrophosphorylase
MAMRSERERLRGLYAITPEASDTAQLVARVAECIEGGAALVQYRAKHAHGAALLVQARAVAEACREGGVPLIVNDSVELAAAVGADGVHLGRDDVSVREARIVLPRALIGVSCYDDPERARAAARDGADYVGIGSMFPSSTKPGAVRCPLEVIERARKASGLPVAAIGGITVGNARSVIAAGADMLAVIAALFEAPDPRAAARAFALLFDHSNGTDDVRTQPQPV